MHERWIQTSRGLKFPLIDINPDTILIEDIAHALSMLCRFNAQCLKPYSVAEHSIHVSYEIEPRLAMIGLMHDAAEAYLGDVPGPLKKCLSDFRKIEDRLIRAIATKFGFTFPDERSSDAHELKRADLQLLVDEKAVTMANTGLIWPGNLPDVKNTDRIQCWGWEEAKRKFLARFEQLELARFV